MSMRIQIELPDSLFAPLERIAKATRRPVDEVLVTALATSLPPLDGLPATLIHELEDLETLDDAALRRVMFEKVPAPTEAEIGRLLEEGVESLDDAERAKLASLQRDADRVMLRKARAGVLLRFRGHRLPTLDELETLEAAAE